MQNCISLSAVVAAVLAIASVPAEAAKDEEYYKEKAYLLIRQAEAEGPGPAKIKNKDLSRIHHKFVMDPG